MTLNLRDYQKQALEHIRHALRSEKRALCVMATGAGKSFMLAALIEDLLKAKSDFKVLFIIHKVQLCRQISDALGSRSIAYGQYCGTLNKYEIEQVTVGLYQSLCGQPNLGQFDFIVVDECHRTSDSYREIMSRCSHDKTRVLGVTATPYMPGGKGYIYGENKDWPKPCYEMGIGPLTEQGYLVRAIPTAPVDKSKWVDTKGLKLRGGDFSLDEVSKRAVKQDLVEAQVADAIPKLRGRHHVIWVTCTIEHSRLLEMELMSIGQSAAVITSEESLVEKDQALVDFDKGKVRHLCSVSVLIEGFDQPKVDAIVFLRPTRSIVTYLQAIGRGLRLYDGKENCLVLDYADVISSLGPIDNPVVLETREGNHHKKLLERSTREQWMQCAECGAFFNQDLEEPVKCPECGAEPRKKDIKDRLRKLKKISSKHSLYSKAGTLEWSLVRAYSFHREDSHIDFCFETDSGKKYFRLQTPNPMRQPTPQQMGQMKWAKRYLEVYFGCHGPSLQAKLIHLGESQMHPKWIAYYEGTNTVAELSDPCDPNALEQVADRAEQERLV